MDNWSVVEHFLFKLKHLVVIIIVFIVAIATSTCKCLIKNNPGYDAIVSNILHENDLSILKAMWQQMVDVMKDMLVLLVV
jgi:hypothetical protein